MVIRQGDVFWVRMRNPLGSEPGYTRPSVVIQSNPFNESGLNTVVLCMITGNLNLANAPGNVPLSRDEANLPRRSVVNITQIVTVDKSDLVEKIGSLSPKRMRQIIDGVNLLLEPREP